MKATLIGMTILAASLAVPGAFAQADTPRARVAASVFTRASYLGIGAQDIDAERAKTLKLKEVRGAEVTSVQAESPAAKAGVKDGDVILEFNGQPVEGKDQLARMVQETPVGRQVKLGIWRNGAAQTVTATTEASKRMVMSGDGNVWAMPEMPKMAPMPPMPPQMEMPKFQMMYPNPILGIFGESLGQQEQLAEFFGVKEGVLVKSVNRDSAAEKAGVKAGDVIIKVDEARVNSTGEITSALRAARSKSSVTLTVVRNKKEMPITVNVESVAPARAVKAGFLLQSGKGVKLQLLPQYRVI